MKGIILAGGSGTRLYPITFGISKQLIPIYNKPMIYYPLSILLLAEIRDILIITTEKDQKNFKQLLGDGSRFGANFCYEVQNKPNGLAEAFLIGEKFINKDNVCLILGDNIFYGNNFSQLLKNAKNRKIGATLFGYNVNDPQRFGIIQIDKNNKIISIEEKPKHPKSNCAVTGLYFYDNKVVDIAKTIKPSDRGELEITSINNVYLNMNQLYLEQLKRGYVWFDTGTYDSILQASLFVKTIENRQKLKIACLEQISLNNNWITKQNIIQYQKLYNNKYGQYLFKIIKT